MMIVPPGVDAQPDHPTTHGRLPLIGRQAQLRQIQSIMDRREPALIVVSGNESTGKTRLLQEVRERAVEQQWRVVPDSKGRELNIAPGVSDENVMGQFDRLLGISGTHERRDDYNAVPATPIQTPTSPAQQAGSKSLVNLYLAGESTESRASMTSSRRSVTMEESSIGLASGSSAQTDQGAATTRRTLPPVIKELRRIAPVLLILDPYQPDEQLATWLRDRYVDYIQGAGAAIVIIVAGRERYVKNLKPVATEYLWLGALGERDVRRHLRMLGKKIAPPMTDEELNVYAKLARGPATLETLSKLLQLLETTT